MIPSQFSYLMSDAQLTKVSADRLETMAKLAAKAYVESGVALQDSIKKMASDSDLNSHQIERVCEMANIATHQALWQKVAAKDEIHFVLADAKKMVKRAEAPTPKGSTMTSSEYNSPPKIASVRAQASFNKLAGVATAPGHDGLLGLNQKHLLKVTFEKKAAARDRAKSELYYAGIKLGEMTKEAFRAVKQAVMGGASFQEVYAAADAAGIGKFANEFLEQFEEKLIAQTYGETRLRLEKTAIGKAPESYLSEGPASKALMVVNGAHPMLISLDTLRKQTDTVEQGLLGLMRMNDELQIYEQKIKELQ